MRQARFIAALWLVVWLLGCDWKLAALVTLCIVAVEIPPEGRPRLV